MCENQEGHWLHTEFGKYEIVVRGRVKWDARVVKIGVDDILMCSGDNSGEIHVRVKFFRGGSTLGRVR